MNKRYEEMTLAEKLLYKAAAISFCDGGDEELANLLRNAAVQIEAYKNSYEEEFRRRLEAEHDAMCYKYKNERRDGF